MQTKRRQLLKWILASSTLPLSCVYADQSSFIHGAAKVSLDKLGIWHGDDFRTRLLAQSGKALNNGFVWPGALDGGGVFAQENGGWIYVCNSELGQDQGGVAALVFDHQGEIVDAYSLLTGSNYNCAGTATPWQTWLSCEEHAQGVVWECDPFRRQPSRRRLALGVFKHESAAVDSSKRHIYMTEDESDGLFYRYLPANVSNDGRYNLEQGILQAASWDARSKLVQWHDLKDAGAKDAPTRYQQDLTAFAGGEGICYRNGMIFFNTKHDDKIWRYDCDRSYLDVVYQAGKGDSLHYADAMTTTPDGLLWAGEDGDNMQIVALDSRSRRQKVLLQIQGQNHSEITGLAFSPDYKRLYFSSQRGPSSRLNSSKHGLTYELEGDFLSWFGRA